MKVDDMQATAMHPETMTEVIRFGSRGFSLGTVMVAVSDKGVAAILMGDDQHALRRQLAGAFPQAGFNAGETGLEAMVAQVAAFLEAPHRGLDLPLDIRGSALEQAVWQALRNVPAGQTVTYGQIAKALPLPATESIRPGAVIARVIRRALSKRR